MPQGIAGPAQLLRNSSLRRGLQQVNLFGDFDDVDVNVLHFDGLGEAARFAAGQHEVGFAEWALDDSSHCSFLVAASANRFFEDHRLRPVSGASGGVHTVSSAGRNCYVAVSLFLVSASAVAPFPVLASATSSGFSAA